MPSSHENHKSSRFACATVARAWMLQRLYPCRRLLLLRTYIQELTVPPVWEPSDVSLCMLSADKGRLLGRLKIVNISWYNFFNPLSNVKGGAGWLAGWLADWLLSCFNSPEVPVMVAYYSKWSREASPPVVCIAVAILTTLKLDQLIHFV